MPDIRKKKEEEKFLPEQVRNAAKETGKGVASLAGTLTKKTAAAGNTPAAASDSGAAKKTGGTGFLQPLLDKSTKAIYGLDGYWENGYYHFGTREETQGSYTPSAAFLEAQKKALENAPNNLTEKDVIQWYLDAYKADTGRRDAYTKLIKDGWGTGHAASTKWAKDSAALAKRADQVLAYTKWYKAKYGKLPFDGMNDEYLEYAQNYGKTAMDWQNMLWEQENAISNYETKEDYEKAREFADAYNGNPEAELKSIEEREQALVNWENGLNDENSTAYRNRYQELYAHFLDKFTREQPGAKAENIQYNADLYARTQIERERDTAFAKYGYRNTADFVYDMQQNEGERNKRKALLKGAISLQHDQADFEKAEAIEKKVKSAEDRVEATDAARKRMHTESHPYFYNRIYNDKDLTDTEREVLLYYFGKDDIDGFDNYYGAIKSRLNQRGAERIAESLEGHPVAETLFGVPAGLEQFGTGMSNWFKGKDGEIQPSKMQRASALVREDMNKYGPKLWNESSLGQVTYDMFTTTANMLPSILAGVISDAVVPGSGRILSAGLLGFSAGGHAYAEMLNAGYSRGQAYLYGILNGASEAGLEYVLNGIAALGSTAASGMTAKIAERLMSAEHPIRSALLKYALEFGKDTISEGFEEGLQEILDPFMWKLVAGEWNADDLDAKGKFKGLDWDEVLYSAFLGALSSVPFNATTGAIRNSQNYKTVMNAIQNGDLATLVDLGLAFEEGTDANALAKLLEGQAKLGLKGKAAAAMMVDSISSELAENPGAVDEYYVRRELEKEKVTGEAQDTLAKIVTRAVSNSSSITSADKITLAKMGNINGKTAARIAERVYRKSFEDASGRGKALNTFLKNRNPAAYNAGERASYDVREAFKAKKAMDAASAAAEVQREYEGRLQANKEKAADFRAYGIDTKTVDAKVDAENGVVPKKIVSVNKRGMRVQLEDGSVVDTADVKYAGRDTAIIYESIKASGMDAETANALLNSIRVNADVNGSALSQWRGLLAAYHAGIHNDRAVQIEGITDRQRQMAFNAGRKALAAENKKAVRRGVDPAEIAKKRRALEAYDRRVAEGQTVPEDNVRTAEKLRKELHDYDVSIRGKGKNVRSIYGKTHYIGDAKTAVKSGRQSVSLKAMAIMTSSITGNDVYFFESEVRDGKRVFSTDIPGFPAYKAGMPAANGFIDNETGAIYIDLNAGERGQGAILWTAAHELTHFLRDWNADSFVTLSDFLMEAYRGSDVDVEALIQAQIEKAAAAGIELTYTEAHEELVADAMQTMFTDADLLNRVLELKARDKGLVEKIHSWLQRVAAKISAHILREYGGMRHDTAEARLLKTMVDDLNRIADVFAQGLVQAGENFQAAEVEEVLGERTIDGEQTEHTYSLRSLADGLGYVVAFNEDGSIETDEHGLVIRDQDGNRVTEPTLDVIINSPLGRLVDASDISADQKDEQYQMLLDMLGMAMKYQDLSLPWEAVGSVVFGAVKSNSDPQYKRTVDFTTICKKTADIINVISRTALKLGRGLTTTEVRRIVYEEVGKAGMPTPCPVCYVFSHWMGLGGILDNMYNFQMRTNNWDEAQVKGFVSDLQRSADRYKQNNPDKYKGDKKNPTYSTLISDMIAAGDKERVKLEKQLNEHYNKVDEIQRLQQQLKDATGDDAKTMRDAIKTLQGELLTEAEIDRIEKRMEKLYHSAADGVGVSVEDLQMYKFILSSRYTGSKVKKYDKTYRPYRDLDRMKTAIFDMNQAETLVTEFPQLWRYRNSRGNGAGKALLPYSEAVPGEVIQGLSGTIALGEKQRISKNKWKYGSEAEAARALRDARIKQRAQNLIGGFRYQSTSDFRFQFGSDYLMTFLEMQAINANVQLYTKVIEAVDFLASTGADVNLSGMPKNNGYKVDKNGNVVLDFSDVTGINAEAAIGMTEKYDNVQFMTVGINDIHIVAALGSKYVSFVIPFHGSGNSVTAIQEMMDRLGQSLDVTTANDYTQLQTDKVIPESKDPLYAEHEAAREARLKLLTGKALDADEMNVINGNKYLKDLYRRFRMDRNAAEYGVQFSKEQAEQIFPYEYWDKTSTYDTADVNGERFVEYCASLGLYPRFSGFHEDNVNVNYGDFTKVPGYWKLLIDRRMYDRNGNYREQQRINVTGLDLDYLSPTWAKEKYGDVMQKDSTPMGEIHERVAEKVIDRINARRATTRDADLFGESQPQVKQSARVQSYDPSNFRDREGKILRLEQDIDELRDEINDPFSDLGESVIRQKKADLNKLLSELENLEKEERREAVKTSYADILKNIDRYRFIDLRSLFSQMYPETDDVDFEELDIDDIKDAIRSKVEEVRTEWTEEGDAKSFSDSRYGLYVRPVPQGRTVSINEAENTFNDDSTGENVRYSIRNEDPPKNTMKGYKVFFVKDGKLYPPMVANPNGADTPVGVWLNADVGVQAPDSKTGRKQVKAGGKGTQGGSGSLAFRPGWHLGEIPLATQFDRLNPETGKKELFPENFVWAECEIAADVDYQEEAMSYGYTKNGKFQHSLAGLPRLPVDGYYKYRTNPNPDTVPWLITGAMKVTRLLSDADVNEILAEHGIAPKMRVGGEKTLADLGLTQATGDISYSLRDQSAMSDRELLSGALMEAAQTEDERARLRRYQKYVETLDNMQTDLQDINDQVKALAKSKDPGNRAKEKALRQQGEKLANRINNYDKSLLKMEAATPLQNIVKRERKTAAAKARQTAKAQERAAGDRRLMRQEISMIKAAGREYNALEARRQRENAAAERKIQKKDEQIARERQRTKEVREAGWERLQKRNEEVKESRKRERDQRASSELKNKIRDLRETMVKSLAQGKGKTAVPAPFVKALIDVCELIDPSPRTLMVRKTDGNGTPMVSDITGKPIYRAVRDGEFTEEQIEEGLRNGTMRYTGESERQRDATKNGVLARLRDVYDSLASSEDSDYKYAYDPEFSQYLLDLRDSLSDKPIREMTRTELQNVYDAMRQVWKRVTDAKKLIGAEYSASLDEMRNKITRETNALPKKLGASKLADFDRAWMTNPIRVAREMSGYDEKAGIARLFTDIVKGYFKGEAIRMREEKVIDAVRKTKADKKRYADACVDPFAKIKNLDGKEFDISLMQAIQTLLTYEREIANENHSHLEYTTYYDNLELLKKGDIAEARRHANKANVTDEALIGRLYDLVNKDKWALRMMDAAKKVLREDSTNEMNATSMELDGVPIAREKAYIPYVIVKEYKSGETENVKRDISVRNLGMTKRLLPNAKTPVLIEGIHLVLEQHIDDVARYAGLAVPARNWNAVFNYGMRADETPVTETINKRWRRGMDILQQAVADAQGPRPEKNNKLFSALKTAFVTATLMGNISVTIKQMASYPTAGVYLSIRSLQYGVNQFLKTAAKRGGMSALYERIDELTPLLYMRRKGLSVQEIAELKKSKFNWLNEKLGPLSPANWIQSADVNTTTALFLACEYEVRRTTKPTDPTFNEKVKDLYEKVLSDTQPMYDPLHRAEISKDSKLRDILMFKTQPIQNSGIVKDAVQDLRFAKAKYGKGSDQAKAAGKHFAKAVTSQLSTAIVFTAMTLLANTIKHSLDRYRDDDKKLTEESILERLGLDLSSQVVNTILPVFGEIGWGVVEKLISKNTSDVISDPTLDMITETVNGFLNFVNKAKEGELTYKTVSKPILQILGMCGIPAKNAENLVRGLWLHIEDAKNKAFFSFEAGVERTVTQQKDLLVDAIAGGDLDRIDEIRQQIIDNSDANDPEGSANNAIKASIKTAFQNGDITDAQAKDYLERYLDITGDDGYWLVKSWAAPEVDRDGDGETDNAKKYDEFVEAVRTGENLESVVADYIEHGAIGFSSAISTAFKDEYVSASGSAKADLGDRITAAYITVNKAKGIETSAWDVKKEILDKWDWAAKNGTEEGYTIYAELLDAIPTGKNLDVIIKDYLAHGKDKSDISRAITEKYKTIYKNLKTNTERAELKKRLLTAYYQAGYDRSKKSIEIDGWLKEKKK